MHLSHRIALDPTVEQEEAFFRACGAARFAWNWALEKWNEQYNAGLKPSGNSLNKIFNLVKYIECSWITNSAACISQQPFLNLDKAFVRFFKKKAKHPKFKRKGVEDGFYMSNRRFSIDNGSICLSKIGSVRLTEPLRLKGKLVSATVSRESNRWFVSVVVDLGDYKKLRIANGEVGIDLGVNTAVQCSNGQSFQAPKPLKKYLKLLQRRSRQHSRKQKGSANRKKAQRKLARLHVRIKNIRKDWTHKVTTKIVRENQTICLEDLNVSGMVKNHRVAMAISDIGFSEIRRQLEYKAKIYDSKIIVIDRWFPSSKTCSVCGFKKDKLSLSQRTFHCDNCGVKIDRDLNAAQNILTVSLTGINACGVEGSDVQTDERETIDCEAGTTPMTELTLLAK